ncbi:MAG: sensor histidine kinase, partial [Pseudobdellovibrionaceae bacterium]
VLLISLESMVDEVVGLKDDSGFKLKLNRCISTVDRMSHIVKSLLIFSQEEQGGGRKRILVEDLIHHTTPLFAEKLAHRKTDFSVLIPQSPIVVNVHPAQISQVVLSLISNSIDALDNLDKKWIRLEVKELSDQIEFCIQDSGPGPQGQDLDRIFQPFFSAKEFGRGMGLGLSISKGIIEAHGGSIFFERRDGATSFVFRLPKVQIISDRIV